jgi:hypothetical protein
MIPGVIKKIENGITNFKITVKTSLMAKKPAASLSKKPSHDGNIAIKTPRTVTTDSIMILVRVKYLVNSALRIAVS